MFLTCSDAASILYNLLADLPLDSGDLWVCHLYDNAFTMRFVILVYASFVVYIVQRSGAAETW